jgi:hypothetical protein
MERDIMTTFSDDLELPAGFIDQVARRQVQFTGDDHVAHAIENLRDAIHARIREIRAAEGVRPMESA